MSVSYADPANLAFVVIPFLLLVTLTFATIAAWQRSGASLSAMWRTTILVGIAAVAWMEATWMLAERGVFQHWDRTPPPFAFLVAGIVIISCLITFSDLGARLARFIPLWILVAVQAFRLPLELAMHAMYERGVMPREMSYSGRNFDIVTGVTAIVVAALVATGRGGKGLVAAWNVLGFALLINVVAVAILGTPRFRYFGEDRLNVWVTYTPFVWLPAVMVLAALAGHLIIFRALGMQHATSRV